MQMNHFLPSSVIETYIDLQDDAVAQSLHGIIQLLNKKDFNTSATSADKQLVKRLNADTLKNKFVKTHIQNIWTEHNSPRSKFHSGREKALSLMEEEDLGDALRFIMDQVSQPTRKQLAKELSKSLKATAPISSDLPISEISAKAAELPFSLQAATRELTRFFTESIFYLGPLRVEPQYIYNLPPFPEVRHVGLKGEFTAPVLEHFKSTKIDYPLPPDQWSEDGSNKKRGKLIRALQTWLEYMGLIEEVRTTDRGKMGTELTVRSKGVSQELDLTSIGVGVSQVLPALVEHEVDLILLDLKMPFLQPLF